MHKPKPAIERALIEKLAKKIEAETGLVFMGSKLRDLERAIPRISMSQGLGQAIHCVEWLLSPPWTQQKTEVCANHLTVAESYFFRESRAFDLLCDYAEKKMASGDPTDTTLRVWSAGCCTGEEAYSIAITLTDRFPDMDARRFAILGTDISPQHLDIARAGHYRNWSMRNTIPNLQRRYFTKTDTGGLRVSESIRSLVSFKEHNLAAQDYSPVLDGGGRMDIIFCRNVLMYFSREQARRVIARLRACLVEGGWLIVNPAEASVELYSGFRPIYFPDAIYFQKCGPAKEIKETAIRQAATFPRATDAPLAVTRPVSATKNRSDIRRGQVSGNKRRLPGPPASSAGAAPAADFHEAALRAIEAGDAQLAARALKAEIYLHPDSVLAYYWLGVVQMGEQQYESAIRQFNTVNLLLDDVPDHSVILGSERFTAAYLRGAVATFRKKLEDRHERTA